MVPPVQEFANEHTLVLTTPVVPSLKLKRMVSGRLQAPVRNVKSKLVMVTEFGKVISIHAPTPSPLDTHSVAPFVSIAYRAPTDALDATALVGKI